MKKKEWFPSISATIGDWAPERNFFHIGMALASGPRFFLVICSYFAIKVFFFCIIIFKLITKKKLKSIPKRVDYQDLENQELD